MTNPASLKLVGNTFITNSTNMASGNTIPTNASVGSNANYGSTYSGYGNSLPGGATLVRILNTTSGLVVITVANNGANIGSIQLQSNTDYFLEKYPNDLIFCNNNSGGVQFTPVAKTW